MGFKLIYLLTICFLLICQTGMAQKISVISSSEDGERLWSKNDIFFSESSAPRRSMMLEPDTNEILIHPEWKFQRIEGFGASFLEAGMICANTLDQRAKDQLFTSLFDSVNGSGFSIMKTVIGGNDFMAASDWFTYDDIPLDKEMKHFSIERDLRPNGLIPYIREAKKHGRFLLQASMDYPPDWMLTDTVRSIQDVNPKYFPALAKYYLRYLEEYKKQSLTINYISLFNEPGIYTKIPYLKIADLIANHVGPLFLENKIDTKILMCESNTRINGWYFYPQVLQNPNAAKYIGGLAFHGYDYGRNFDKIAELHQNYPNLPILMTEVCHAYVCGTKRTFPLPNYGFSDGDFWGNQIISDLESGISSWIYWNMILDENGGPWLVSEVHGNPEANIQHPVVVVNRTDKKVHYTGLYYYLSHFSKYVRPGYIRIGIYEQIEGVRAVAFSGPDNNVVLQIVNSSNKRQEIKLREGDRHSKVWIASGSITTLLWKD